MKVEMERDALLATVKAHQEDMDHVEKYKQEILKLKLALDDSKKDK